MKNKIKELREEFNQKLDALEKGFKEEKKNPLVPKIGQEYYYIYSDGTYNQDYWKNKFTDNKKLAIGNVFLTEQAVKDEIKKRTAIQTIRLYIAENFPFEPDWDDNEQVKYDIYYDTDSKEHNVIYHRYYQPQTQAQTQIGFLKSKENCKEIISKFKNELDIIFKAK